MNFLIADTFLTSLERLNSQEQKAVKMTAFDLQVNPAHPGVQLHRVDRARDKGFWSARASRDLRLICHRGDSSLVLCYVGHHDDAYTWAQRRRLEAHPKTGAAQIVEIRETVEEIRGASSVAVRPVHTGEPLPCQGLTRDELLAWGIPDDWIDDIRTTNEDRVLAIAERLPQEASEAILEYIVSGTVRTPEPTGAETDPFTHPEATRRFRVVAGAEELEAALSYPWERWIVFLHPHQRGTAEQDWSGPARVSGSAGTGKTIVAIHRAAHLATVHDTARILLTTFSSVLAQTLAGKLDRLLAQKPRVRERIEVRALDDVAWRIWTIRSDGRTIMSDKDAADLVRTVVEDAGISGVSPLFAVSEWQHIVDLHGLYTWESYRDVRRLGRKVRLAESRRRELWNLYETVRDRIRDRHALTLNDVYYHLAGNDAKTPAPYDMIVADEAQDISPAQLTWLGSVAGPTPNGLFFAGDIGQRIFRQPFSWSALGVDVRGRSRVLRVNYRTSHQIRTHADRLPDPTLTDPDGQQEERTGTISLFTGPDPEVKTTESREEEVRIVGEWLHDTVTETGAQPAETGIIVRSDRELDRARAAASELVNLKGGVFVPAATYRASGSGSRLLVIPLAVQSRIGGRRATHEVDGIRTETFVESMRPRATLRGHLTFHFKHEEPHLELLSRLFERVDSAELITWIEA